MIFVLWLEVSVYGEIGGVDLEVKISKMVCAMSYSIEPLKYYRFVNEWGECTKHDDVCVSTK